MRGVKFLLAPAIALALGQTGCAMLFRESEPVVRVTSDPPGGQASVAGAAPLARPTPVDVPVSRAGFTEVRVRLAGFEEHHGSVRKHVNGWWLTADVATCIVPVMLCLPLLIDAISGAWIDVEKVHAARLVPLARAMGVRTDARAAAPPRTAGRSAPVASTMSESERKASARAAYLEGTDLQARGRDAEALARFQEAQRIFDAPTHQLHIAQCLALTGKLVEARETYETLAHRALSDRAPEPFRDAVVTGQRELAELRPRIPTLRIEVHPAPSTLPNLAVSINQRPLPNEVLGIARPMNPGTYRLTATAWGVAPARAVEVTLVEKDVRSVELRLGE